MLFAKIKQFKLQYISDNEYYDLDNQDDFDIYLEDNEQNPIILTNLLQEIQNLTIKIDETLFKIKRKEQYEELKLEIENELKIIGEYNLKFFDGDEAYDISNQDEYDEYLRDFLSQSSIILKPSQVEKPILIPKANEEKINIPPHQPISQIENFKVVNEKQNFLFIVQQSSSNDQAKPTEQIISVKEKQKQNQDQDQDQDQAIEGKARLPQIQKILFENLSDEQKEEFDFRSNQYQQNKDLAELKGEIEALNFEEIELLIKYSNQEYKKLNDNKNSEIMNIEKQKKSL